MPPLHLSTILAQSPSTLLTQITRLSSKYGGKGHTVLFALSSNFPVADDLQAVVNGLNAFNNVGGGGHQPSTSKSHARGRTIGCLVDSFSSTSLSGSCKGTVAPTHGSKKMEDVLSCSIGIFDSSLCVPFRSELLGRTQTQVGKWHAFRKRGDSLPAGTVDESTSRLGQAKWEPDWGKMDSEADSSSAKSGVDWEQIWNRSSSNASSTSSNLDLLPEAIRSINPGQIQALVTLSSPRPDTLTDVLSKSLPNSPSLTLIASPTHFITGRPVTLFVDGQIHGEGAVGLALLHSPNSNSKLGTHEGKENKFSYRTEFLGVTRLSSPMVITSREGNMINELDSSNPTKLLIQAIELAGLLPSSTIHASGSTGAALTSSTPTQYFKDEEQFALGVLTPDGQILRTYRITAGDPSSRGGSLSLDAPVAPEIGSVVQFLHFPSNSQIEISPSFTGSTTTSTSNSSKQIACLTVPEAHFHTAANGSCSATDSDVGNVLKDTFIVPCTQGFIFSPASNPILSKNKEVMWTCSLPGGSVVLEWDDSTCQR